MSTLSNEAQLHLDHYLQQVRRCLQGCKSVDADDVERDVQEHIAVEFEDKEEPVTLSELETVLERLGSPSQWIPEDELSE